MEKFKNNYHSLRNKLEEEYPLPVIIQFCVYFDSDDENLFREFAASYNPPGDNSDLLIRIYAKRYDLDPIKDLKVIRNLYVDNVLNNGYSYHLTTNVNAENILKEGLNPPFPTEEEKELEDIKSMLTEEGLKSFFPFHNQERYLFYSKVLKQNVRYGRAPEWLQDLKIGTDNIETFGRYESSDAKIALMQFTKKYVTKYKDAKRIVIMIPNRLLDSSRKNGKLTSEMLDKTGLDVKSLIQQLERVLKSQIDERSKNFIPGDNLIYIEEKSGKILFEESEFGKKISI